MIRQLVKTGSFTIIATHDLKLGELENKYQGIIHNYCFESYIDGKDLSFDYKLTPGIAKNMNASFLMKRMDII